MKWWSHTHTHTHTYHHLPFLLSLLPLKVNLFSSLIIFCLKVSLAFLQCFVTIHYTMFVPILFNHIFYIILQHVRDHVMIYEYPIYSLVSQDIHVYHQRFTYFSIMFCNTTLHCICLFPLQPKFNRLSYNSSPCKRPCDDMMNTQLIL